MPWVPGSPGGREYHQSEELFFTLHTVLADASKLIGLFFSEARLFLYLTKNFPSKLSTDITLTL